MWLTGTGRPPLPLGAWAGVLLCGAMDSSRINALSQSSAAKAGAQAVDAREACWIARAGRVVLGLRDGEGEPGLRAALCSGWVISSGFQSS
jgi:hypothetical protein